MEAQNWRLEGTSSTEFYWRLKSDKKSLKTIQNSLKIILKRKAVN